MNTMYVWQNQETIYRFKVTKILHRTQLLLSNNGKTSTEELTNSFIENVIFHILLLLHAAGNDSNFCQQHLLTYNITFNSVIGAPLAKQELHYIFIIDKKQN